jgi:hypothetical protein
MLSPQELLQEKYAYMFRPMQRSQALVAEVDVAFDPLCMIQLI